MKTTRKRHSGNFKTKVAMFEPARHRLSIAAQSRLLRTNRG